ncbi:MAG: hypothetical protein E6I57_04635 [Chloroflexi bacterium]|nr:MAG: hypothetical protein E6I57_04635 [Chloroflexota bacterium]
MLSRWDRGNGRKGLKGFHSTGLLRVAQLLLVTFLAFGAGWQAALVAGASLRMGDVTALSRAEGEARGLARSAATDTAASRMGASGRSLVLASGVPVSVVDGGASRALRVARGSTAAEVLEAAGLTLGALDRLETSVDGTVDAGDVVRVVRVSESVAVVREPIAFAVTTVPDPTLVRGKAVVVTAGVPGLAENTYRVRTADGAVEERLLVASTQLQAPVAEVRRVGTQAPPVPGDIASIIRSAAANWGADPDQLLRVAWCESRYNPSAYNPSSGASGLFQFLASTWAANSVRAGYAGASPFDAVANANTAAYMFANGQARQWSCR